MFTPPPGLPCTFFDLRDYECPLRNENPKDDDRLIPLFKILSPTYLLRLPFVNDSNSLDLGFYNELLHIIGLEETKEKTKRSSAAGRWCADKPLGLLGLAPPVRVASAL